jgi:DNA polymerase-1
MHDAKPQLHALARAAWARGLGPGGGGRGRRRPDDHRPGRPRRGRRGRRGRRAGEEQVSEDGTTGARAVATAIAGLPAGDTSLAAYLCRPDQRSYDLADLSVRHLGRTLVTAEPVVEGEPVEEQLSLGLDAAEDAPGVDATPEDLADAARARRDLRAGIRAAAVAELDAVLLGELAEREGTALLADLELPLERVLLRIESTGIAVDVEHLEQLREHYDVRVSEAARLAFAEIDEEINLGSPKQLQRVLFEKLAMPKTKRTKTGYTTDAEALQDLYESTEHPFLLHLLEHRDAIRLRQTVEGLLASVGEDARIRTTFQQTIAATGRLSSTDPNLQNIPIRTDEGRRIRSGFVVGSDATGPLECLMSADYSQIEMRIMAHLSGDEGLIEAFTAGEDLHRFVGSRVFQVTPAEVTPEMRAKVKAMSYGLAYGLSAFGLSRQLRTPVDEARGLMDEYFLRFGGVRDYLRGVVDQARKDGWTATLLGRRRYLPDLTSDNRQRREAAERMALNAPIQGSAADLIKVAMLRVQERLDAGTCARACCSRSTTSWCSRSPRGSSSRCRTSSSPRWAARRTWRCRWRCPWASGGPGSTPPTEASGRRRVLRAGERGAGSCPAGTPRAAATSRPTSRCCPRATRARAGRRARGRRRGAAAPSRRRCGGTPHSPGPPSGERST